MKDRLKKEKTFHNIRFGGEDRRSCVSKYYSVTKHSEELYRNLVLERSRGASLLEYGCGRGKMVLDWARNGAVVDAIDISEKAVMELRLLALEERLNIKCHVMNAEDLEFGEDYFDLVTGKGILHHLDLDKSYSEVARVLVPSGCAIFVEPLGHNCFIGLYRKLTRSLRTEDEHPLSMADIERAKSYFDDLKVEYFHILTLLAVPLRKLPFFDRLINCLHSADQVLMTFMPFMRRFAWMVVIVLRKPLKGDKRSHDKTS